MMHHSVTEVSSEHLTELRSGHNEAGARGWFVCPVIDLQCKFEKVFLKAGETQRVTFQITDEDLSYYNVMMHKWVVENGVYDLYLAASSRDIRAKVSIEYNDPSSYSMQVLDAMIG